TNSTCGGPGEQDTMDAIHVEELRRHVGGVYLYGDSMGSLGALAFAAHRPGVVSGGATTGEVTEALEPRPYRATPTGDRASLACLTCGILPSPKNATAIRVYEYVSVVRFVPTNLSGVKIWVASGAKDFDAPNNASIWPFLQVNDTFLTSTCRVASRLGEPAN